MTEILTHMNFKGGSSKTTLNLNFCLEFCHQFKDAKVLYIDADPQANSTKKLVNKSNIKHTLRDALIDDISLGNIIIEKPISKFKNLDVIASDINMIVLELALNSRVAKEFVLMNYFAKEDNKKILEKYDLVVFDLNPAISILNINIMLCCDSIVPVLNLADEDTIESKNLLIEVFEDIKNALRIKKDNIKPCVITKNTKRENSLTEKWDRAMQQNGEYKNTLDNRMSQSIHYIECLNNQENITSYLKENKKKTDIKNEITELIKEYQDKQILRQKYN